jgi:predicted dehydrogenase
LARQVELGAGLFSSVLITWCFMNALPSPQPSSSSPADAGGPGLPVRPRLDASLRAAVIGAGRMGRRHVQIITSLGLPLVALADQNAAALVEARSQLLLPESIYYQNLEALLDTHPDVLVAATTAPAHHDVVCRAAERGVRFILCEKPMAVSLRQCDHMLEVCQRHGVHLAVNHQMRFMEQYLAPRQLLDSTAFGGLSSVNVTAGNFGLAMNASHYFEMFRFLTGEAPAVVSAWFGQETIPNPRGAQFVDRAGCVRACTAGGKRFYLDCGGDQGHGMYVVYGARYGQVAVDELRGQMTWTCRKAEHRELPTTRYGMPWDQGSADIAPADALAPTRAVLEALLRQDNYPTGRDGRLAVATLVAATVSNDNGHRPVTLAEAGQHADRVFPWA